MRPTRLLQTTYFAMIALQTLGTVDSQHRLPPPRAFVAITVLWGSLFLLIDTRLRNFAARLAMLVLLTATVLGPFGKRLVALLNTVSKGFAIQPSTPTTAPTAAETEATTADLAAAAIQSA